MPELVAIWPPDASALPVWRHARIVPGEPSPFPDLPDDVWQALSDAETRPRAASLESGTLLLLRGVNVNPGTEPEDMVSIRLWIGPRGMVSVTLRRLFAREDTFAALEAGMVTAEPYAIIRYLAERLAIRIRSAIADMDEAANAVEEELLDTEHSHDLPRLQNEVRRLRRRAVWLRRHLAPQSAALYDFNTLAEDAMPPGLAEDFSELANEMQRATEAVHTLAEYGTLLQDQLDSIRSAQMARTSYVLSLVAAIFLPLNLIAAVFGANVAGVPWAENPWGFVLLSLLCLAITAAGVLMVRWRRWM